MLSIHQEMPEKSVDMRVSRAKDDRWGVGEVVGCNLSHLSCWPWPEDEELLHIGVSNSVPRHGL